LEVSLKSLVDGNNTDANVGTDTNVGPFIEDITQSYTREKRSDVCQRRDESESFIQASILKASSDLRRKLLEYYKYTSFPKEEDALKLSR
jgi:hypothetical protein